MAMSDEDPDWLPIREYLDREIRPQLIEVMLDRTVDPYVRAHLAAFLDQTVAKCIDQIEISMLRRQVMAEDRVVHLPLKRRANGH
jgi:hypothetical protein